MPCIQFLCLTIYWSYARFPNVNKISLETKMISLFILKFEKHSITLYFKLKLGAKYGVSIKFMFYHALFMSYILELQKIQIMNVITSKTKCRI